MDKLKVYNASKIYKNKCILKDIHFSCKVGEIIGIFGRNGSGKSTLLKMVFGTVKADSINIEINSEVFYQKSIIPSQLIGYLPQDTCLPKERRVRDVIPMFYPNGADQDTIFYAPQVARFEKNKIGELSLGQLRYLELLIIGNLNHKFLMLDEPFSMIEPIYKDVIKNFLVDLKKTKGIILTDHYYNDVLEISDKNFLIKESQKIEILDKTDLFNNDYLSCNH